MGKTEKITSIVGCARCHGEGHENLIFEKLTYPLEAPDGTKWSWWSQCPTNGQPIMLRITDAP